MDLSPALSNLLSPPILFFALGAAAALSRSDLEIPQPIPKLLSLYLLMAIGFHGGVELRHGSFGWTVAATLGAALAMAVLVPLYSFWILRLKLAVPDAAAIAATYGSISAVTFITAASHLEARDIPYGGHLVAAMALMESPAAILGVLFVRRHAAASGESPARWGTLLREALLNGSIVLLTGSLLIGLATGAAGMEAMGPFSKEIFKGVLAFFLLDMGIVAARRLRDLRRAGAFLAAFAVIVPLLNAALGIGLSRLLGLGPGDALLFTVLCASASYIAVPAVMRLAVPEANPSLYLPMSLGVTFPFNIVVGIPLYEAVLGALGGR